MDLKDLVPIYFERGNEMQVLWGLYITIVIGLLAFFGAAPASVKKIHLTAILSLGFIGFAAVNADAIYDVNRARWGIWSIISQLDSKAPQDRGVIAMVKTIQPPPELGTMIFHVSSDIAVLTAIWILTLRQKRMPHSNNDRN